MREETYTTEPQEEHCVDDGKEISKWIHEMEE